MIQWLLQSVHDINEQPELFLNPTELARFDSFHFEKRRRDWLVGRWTAKCLLQAVLRQEDNQFVSRQALEIFNTRDGAPYARIRGRTLSLHLSISHSHGYALCAVDAGPIGADLELVEAREPSFTADYFTANEQAHFADASRSERNMVITGYWSAKESVLKAIHAGLSLDTRAIEIYGAPSAHNFDCWMPFGVAVLSGDAIPIRGWWRVRDNLVLTLATTTHDVPAAIQTSPEYSNSMSGDYNGQGHGVLSRRIAQSTRHHARHAQRN